MTQSGVIMCERTVPFSLVKEIWLCVPGSDRRNVYEQVEKILDSELEDEICTDWQRPLTPVAEKMKSCRSHVCSATCQMDLMIAMKADIVARLSEYCGADWNEVDWHTTRTSTSMPSTFSSFILLPQGMQERVATRASGSDSAHGASALHLRAYQDACYVSQLWYPTGNTNGSKVVPILRWRFLNKKSHQQPWKKLRLFQW